MGRETDKETGPRWEGKRIKKQDLEGKGNPIAPLVYTGLCYRGTQTTDMALNR